MKDKNINFSIPASFVFDNTELNSYDDNKFLTKAKVKVFYKGTTPDNRTFTESFSQKVLSSLPGTPVVGYFDEESQDFQGHNSVQYVYGFVPEVGRTSFEEIDGQTWAVTDVYLFTGRNDNIGNVARQIIGKKQSLELDPESTEYEIRRASNKSHEIIFTNTNGIVGLSVLGDNQTPGFTDSEFFTAKSMKTLEDLIREFAEYKTKPTVFEDLTSNCGQDGGVSVEKENKIIMPEEMTEIITQRNDFMKQSFDEIQLQVFNGMCEQFPELIFEIVQISAESLVYFDYETMQYQRMNYSIEEDVVTFDEPVTVKVRFLTNEEILKVFNIDDLYEVKVDEGFSLFSTVDAAKTQEYIDSLRTEVVVEKIVEVEVEKNQFTAEELSILQKEREELAAYRLQEKKDLLNEYAALLTEEELESIDINEFDNINDLKAHLSIMAWEKIKENKDFTSNTVRIVNLNALGGQKAKKEEDIKRSLIQKYL